MLPSKARKPHLLAWRTHLKVCSLHIITLAAVCLLGVLLCLPSPSVQGDYKLCILRAIQETVQSALTEDRCSF